MYFRDVLLIRPPRAWGRRPPAKPANEVITGFGVGLSGTLSPPASACEPFREAIELGLIRRLVERHGYRFASPTIVIDC
jgi:hypothetical protein